MQAQKDTAICIICSRLCSKNSLRILGKDICSDCEKGLITASVDDEKYYFYINGLKKIWRFDED